MSKHTPRTDIHRPGMIQPHLYTFIGWYYFGLGGVGSVIAVSERLEKFRISEECWDFGALTFGSFGKCGVCGARFAMGEVWQHVETMDFVHIGHDCAEKYDLVSGTNWTALQDMRDRSLKAQKTAARNIKRKAAMALQYPGLEAALKTDHRIVKDIASRYEDGVTLSEKQVELVFKLANQVATRATRPEEAHVNAPEGRVVARGTVVSKKVHESEFGQCLKMTVKIMTPEGSWLAWGTVPSGLNPEIGATVEFTGTFTRSTDKPFFAFFKRPSKASLIPAQTEMAS